MNRLAEEYKHATTVIRGKDGRVVGIEEMKESREARLRQANDSNMKQWVGGMVQYEWKVEKRRELEESRGQPMTRHEVPVEVEVERMEQERFDDPLKKILRREKTANLKSLNQTLMMVHPSRFAGTANRYGILPGSMWDGVDRGSGFEAKYLEKMNQVKAKGDQEYFDHAMHL